MPSAINFPKVHDTQVVLPLPALVPARQLFGVCDPRGQACPAGQGKQPETSLLRRELDEYLPASQGICKVDPAPTK